MIMVELSPSFTVTVTYENSVNVALLNKLAHLLAVDSAGTGILTKN